MNSRMDMTNRQIIRAIFTVVLAMMMAISTPAVSLAAEDDAQVSVKGLITYSNVKANNAINDQITIDNAEGRDVRLQQKSDNGEWKTIKTYYIEEESAGHITLAYPKRTKTYTYWRLHIDATDEESEFNSEMITIVSRNVKSISLSAKSAVIYCVDDGTVSYGKYMNTKRPMASTTKVMTAIVALENVNVAKKKMKIPKYVTRTPYANLHMRKGDKYRMRDLFRTMLISSSNDAARAVAHKTAGSQKKFVKKMNAKAKALGLSKTHFTGAVGFDSKKHYTTASDLAKLMAYAYEKPEFRVAIKKKSYSFKNTKGNRKHKGKSTSKSMFAYPKNFKGGKTGTTGRAKCCFVGVYKVNGKTYVAVNLGSSTNTNRWKDAKKLYKYIKSTSDSGKE